MKDFISIISFAILFCALSNSYATDTNVLQKEDQKSLADMAQKQECWSAKDCTGKVLSNRDAHNCKVKSHGKSWSNKQGVCSNL